MAEEHRKPVVPDGTAQATKGAYRALSASTAGLELGIAVALGLGDNTKAMLITRGLAEMARLGEAMGADPRTFAGLAGMGDLVATCSSPLSRNRRFGEYLGRGLNVAQAKDLTIQTAEGVTSHAPVLELARKYGAEMPITEVVGAVITGRLTVGDAAAVLMSRSAKPEWYSAELRAPAPDCPLRSLTRG
ncbi:MAG: NAD(P)H-dependent glycerol-3-phosphate dehydrogenase, partial [Gemmatimonadales bacterium]